MAEKRGKVSPTVSDQEPPAVDPDPSLARIRIRQRWEFASVLNFLHVFKPLIGGGDLGMSAEEIETALITPNDDLARVHIALLKGIPPVNKNLTVSDAWVTVLCKKLATWWPWVAEGENPLKVDHGNEIQKYKALDPINRVMILKALCEVRVQQDDVLKFIADELKRGTEITTFRKERLGGSDGVCYWCDGDPVIGHRLYKEVVRVESKTKSKGKGCAAQPTIDYHWETLATDLDEFQQVSVNLSSSKINEEASISELVKTEIIPVLEKLQQKKERALKRQQRQALELNNFSDYSRVGAIRSCRERKPVRYTFDEYDRTIDEAIQISKKLKTTALKKDNAKQGEQLSHQIDRNGKLDEGDSESEGLHDSLAKEDDEDQCDSEQDNDEEDEDVKFPSHDDDDDDDDFDENDENREGANVEDDDDDDDNADSNSSDAEKGNSPKQAGNQKATKTKFSVGLRRSQRFVEPSDGIAETKKRLRQRLTRNSAQIISDSEDSSSENEKQTEAILDSEMDE